MTNIFCRIFSSGKQKRKDEKRVAKRKSAEPGSIEGDTSWNLGWVTSSCLGSVGRKREGKSTVLKANLSQTTETGWAAWASKRRANFVNIIIYGYTIAVVIIIKLSQSNNAHQWIKGRY
jgi:hypothetical protein